MKPITITVTPGMAEHIREFCFAHKAIHTASIQRHEAAIIELDNLAMACLVDDQDALESELVESLGGATCQYSEDDIREWRGSYRGTETNAELSASEKLALAEQLIGGPTSEPKPSGSTPINFFNDKGEVYQVHSDPINELSSPEAMPAGDATAMNTWLVDRWSKNLIVGENLVPINIKCPRAISTRWGSKSSVDQILGKLKDAVIGESLRIFHDKKDVQQYWTPIYDFAVSLKNIDKVNCTNLLSEFFSDLREQQLSREGAK